MYDPSCVLYYYHLYALDYPVCKQYNTTMSSLIDAYMLCFLIYITGPSRPQHESGLCPNRLRSPDTRLSEPSASAGALPAGVWEAMGCPAAL